MWNDADDIIEWFQRPVCILWRQKNAEIKFDELIGHFRSMPFDLKVWYLVEYLTVLAFIYLF